MRHAVTSHGGVHRADVTLLPVLFLDDNSGLLVVVTLPASRLKDLVLYRCRVLEHITQRDGERQAHEFISGKMSKLRAVGMASVQMRHLI